jgi:hypothetical protein
MHPLLLLCSSFALAFACLPVSVAPVAPVAGGATTSCEGELSGAGLFCWTTLGRCSEISAPGVHEVEACPGWTEGCCSYGKLGPSGGLLTSCIYEATPAGVARAKAECAPPFVWSGPR